MSDTVMKDKPMNTSTARDIKEQAQAVKEEVRELSRMAGEDARDRLAEARVEGERILDQARTRSREAIESRPFTSVAVAAGLGALVAGILLKLK